MADVVTILLFFFACVGIGVGIEYLAGAPGLPRLRRKPPPPLDLAARRRADRIHWVGLQKDAMALWEMQCGCPEPKRFKTLDGSEGEVMPARYQEVPRSPSPQYVLNPAYVPVAPARGDLERLQEELLYWQTKNERDLRIAEELRRREREEHYRQMGYQGYQGYTQASLPPYDAYRRSRAGKYSRL